MAGNTHIKENSVNILLVNVGANPAPRTTEKSPAFEERASSLGTSRAVSDRECKRLFGGRVEIFVLRLR
jgi:hypothetical protein